MFASLLTLALLALAVWAEQLPTIGHDQVADGRSPSRWRRKKLHGQHIDQGAPFGRGWTP